MVPVIYKLLYTCVTYVNNNNNKNTQKVNLLSSLISNVKS